MKVEIINPSEPTKQNRLDEFQTNKISPLGIIRAWQDDPNLVGKIVILRYNVLYTLGSFISNGEPLVNLFYNACTWKGYYYIEPLPKNTEIKITI